MAKEEKETKKEVQPSGVLSGVSKKDKREETPTDKGNMTVLEVKDAHGPTAAVKKDVTTTTLADDESEELSPEMEELAKKYKGVISEIEKLSVVELAELVQVLEKKFGVSAVTPVAAVGVGEEGEAEEKDAFNIMLQSAGDLKINVIKVVREITGLGLKESKAIVDGAPKMIKEGVKTEEANEFKKKLEEAGATVELQ